MKLYIKIFLFFLSVFLISSFVFAEEEDNTYSLLPQNSYGVIDIHGAPIPPKNPKDLLQVDIPHEDTVRVNLSTGKLSVKAAEFNVPCRGYDKELALSFTRTYGAGTVAGGNLLGTNWKTNHDVSMHVFAKYDPDTGEPVYRLINIHTNEGHAQFQCHYWNIDYYQPMGRFARQTKIFKVAPPDKRFDYLCPTTYIWQSKHGIKYYFEPYYFYVSENEADAIAKPLEWERTDYRLKKIEDRNGNTLEYTYLLFGGKINEPENVNEAGEATLVTRSYDGWPGIGLTEFKSSIRYELVDYFGDDVDLEASVSEEEAAEYFAIRSRRPSRLTNIATGRYIEFTYHPSFSVDDLKKGLLKTVADPVGNEYSFDYIEVTHPFYPGRYGVPRLYTVQKPGVSNPTTYAHSYFGSLLLTITDPLHNTMKMSYNGSVVSQYQYITRVTSPDGNYFKLHYSDYKMPRNVDVTYSDRPNVKLVYKFDHEGRLNGTESWENDVKIWYEWYSWENSRGSQFFTNLLSTGESGCGEDYLWTYEGDSENPVTHSMPGNRKKVYTYNEFNKVTKEELTSWSTGEVLRVTEFVYDVNGNLTSKIEDSGGPDEIITNYGYDDGHGNRTSVTDPNGNITTFIYDNYGNVLNMTDPEGNITSYTHDINGNKLSQTDARGNVTTYKYDALNRLEKIIFPKEDDILEPPVKTYVYNDNSDVEFITDENGNTTEYQYDSNARLYRKIDPLGYFVEYGYDSTGNTISQKDKNAKTTSYGYDALNRKISETDCIEKSITYSYGDLFTRCGSAMFEGSSFNPTAITDKRGNTTEYQYDNRYWLQFIRYPGIEGYEEHFEYDVFGNKTLWIDTNGQFWRYYYDNVNRLTKQTDPVNYDILYGYDNNGNKTSETDKRGNTTTFEYDGTNRFRKAIDPYFEYTEYFYDGVGNKISERDKRGNYTNFIYNKRNRLEEVITEPETGVTYTKTYEYDDKGNKTAEVNENGNRTEYTYTIRDELWTIKDAYNNSISYLYDANGNKDSETDKKGNTTAYLYTNRNELLTVTDPLDNSINYTYDDNGNKKTETDKRNLTTTFAYDERSLLISVTDHEENISSFTYDGNKNKLTETNPLLHETTYTYDSLNRLKTNTDAENNIITNYYDENGNLLAVMDANGKVTFYEYDKLNQIIEVADPENGNSGAIEYSYDENGNKISMNDQRTEDNITTYEYDALNRLISNITPMWKLTTYEYDGVGNRIIQEDANGDTITYTYDRLNRLEQKTYIDSTTVTYAYDENSNRTRMVDGTGVYNYEYDELNRLILEQSPNGLKVYSYDENGNRDFIGYSGKNISYTYDTLNRLVQITDADGEITQYEYDDAGRVLKTIYPNGIQTGYSYFDNNWLKTLTSLFNAANILDIEYTYDNVGNKISMIEKHVSPVTLTSYEYDNLYRLTQVTYPDSLIETYTYDAAGNRLTKSNGASNEVYVYNDDNELTTRHVFGQETGEITVTGTVTDDIKVDRVIVNGIPAVIEGDNFHQTISVASGQNTITVAAYDTSGNNVAKSLSITYLASGDDAYSYEYDSNGNTIKTTKNNEDTIFSYDYENRMIGAVTPAGAQITYAYDGDKRRYSKTVDETTTKFLYDGINILTDLDGSGAITKEYTQGLGIDSLIKATDGENPEYYHSDALGSTRLITDANGNTVKTYDYDAWGKVTNETGSSDNEYTYTARRVEDELGLMYYRARFYDTETGRFLQKDPLTGGPDDPRICYASNIYGMHKTELDSNTAVLNAKLFDIKREIEREKLSQNIKQKENEKYSSYVQRVIVASLEKEIELQKKYSGKTIDYLRNEQQLEWGLDPHNTNRYVYCLNSPINYIDPLGLDIWYLRDREAVAQKGHTALLVGDEKKGYYYLSYGPASAKSKRGLSGLRKYKTFENAEKALSRFKGNAATNRYDDYMRFQTTPEQDRLATRKFLKESLKDYKLTGHNCDFVSTKAMKEAGIPLRDRAWVTPNRAWKNVSGWFLHKKKIMNWGKKKRKNKK